MTTEQKLILTFCENLAELGCPLNTEPDMWFRNMDNGQQLKIIKKIKKLVKKDSR